MADCGRVRIAVHTFLYGDYATSVYLAQACIRNDRGFQHWGLNYLDLSTAHLLNFGASFVMKVSAANLDEIESPFNSAGHLGSSYESS